MSYQPLTSARPRDLSPESFSPASNMANQPGFETVYDRPLPEFTTLMARHMGYLPFISLLKGMGLSSGHSKPTVGHYEEPWNTDTVTVGSVITAPAAAGDGMVVELTAASMYDSNNTANGGAMFASFPIERDIIELYDRTQVQVTTKNTSVNPHRLTLTPIDSSIDLTGKVVADDEFAVMYNLHPEGSGLPAMRVPRFIKYSNPFAILKTAYATTGSEMTNSIYHELVPGGASSAGKAIYVKLRSDDLRRHEKYRSNLMLFGQTANNLTEFVANVGADMPMNGTEGLIDFATTSGNSDTYTPGSYALSDFNAIARTYYNERSTGTNQLISLVGPDLAEEQEDLFTTILSATPDVHVDRLIPEYSDFMSGTDESLDYDAGDMMLNFGVTAVKKNGFIFYLKRLNEFSDIKGAGGTGYDYRKYSITMPLGIAKDSNSNNMSGTLGYRYKALEGYSRDLVVGSLPGVGVGGNTRFGTPVNEFDSYREGLLSEIAPHFACANTIVIQTPA